MKIKIPKPKLNSNNIMELVIAGGIFAGLGYGLFYLGQRSISMYSYQNMDRQQVLQLAKEVDSRMPILSRACKDGGRSCRGIYLPQGGGGMMYYHLDDDPENNKASYNLYSVPNELWTTQSTLIPGLGGLITQIGNQKY